MKTYTIKPLLKIFILLVFIALTYNNCAKFQSVQNSSSREMATRYYNTIAGANNSYEADIPLGTFEIWEYNPTAVTTNVFTLHNKNDADIALTKMDAFTQYPGPSYSSDMCLWVGDIAPKGYSDDSAKSAFCLFSTAATYPTHDMGKYNKGVLVPNGENVTFQGAPNWNTPVEGGLQLTFAKAETVIPTKMILFPQHDTGYQVSGSVTVPAGCDSSCTSPVPSVVTGYSEIFNSNRWYRVNKDTFMRGITVFFSTGGSTASCGLDVCIKVWEANASQANNIWCFSMSGNGSSASTFDSAFGNGGNAFLDFDYYVSAGSAVGVEYTIRSSVTNGYDFEGAIHFDAREYSAIPESQRVNKVPASTSGSSTSSGSTSAASNDFFGLWTCMFSPALCSSTSSIDSGTTSSSTTLTPTTTTSTTATTSSSNDFLNTWLCMLNPLFCSSSSTTTTSTTSQACNTLTQPSPDWGTKSGQCLLSCGGLGGTAAYSDPCANHGMADAGSAYDVTYCCKAQTQSTGSTSTGFGSYKCTIMKPDVCPIWSSYYSGTVADEYYNSRDACFNRAADYASWCGTTGAINIYATDSAGYTHAAVWQNGQWVSGHLYDPSGNMVQ